MEKDINNKANKTIRLRYRIFANTWRFGTPNESLDWSIKV